MNHIYDEKRKMSKKNVNLRHTYITYNIMVFLERPIFVIPPLLTNVMLLKITTAEHEFD